MPIYAVVERFNGGTNVLLHKTLKKAEKRFEVILGENLDPDELDKDVIVKVALENHYWSTCEGDYEQEIILEIQTLEFEK